MWIKSVAYIYFSNGSYNEGVIKNEYLSTFEYFIGRSCYIPKKNDRYRNDYVYERNDISVWIFETTKPIFIFQ